MILPMMQVPLLEGGVELVGQRKADVYCMVLPAHGVRVLAGKERGVEGRGAQQRPVFRVRRRVNKALPRL